MSDLPSTLPGPGGPTGGGGASPGTQTRDHSVHSGSLIGGPASGGGETLAELRAITADLRQQNQDLREQQRHYIDHYNEEISRLGTFKMLIQSQLRGEATRLLRVENEKNDLLYQGKGRICLINPSLEKC